MLVTSKMCKKYITKYFKPCSLCRYVCSMKISVWWLSSLNLGSCLDSFAVINRCIYYQEVLRWHFHTILFLIQNRSFLEKHTITGTFKVLHQISLKSSVPKPTFPCWKSEEVFGLCNLAVQQSMWNYNVLSSIPARSFGFCICFIQLCISVLESIDHKPFLLEGLL